MLIRCLIIVMFFISPSFQQAQKFPNIDYVSKGYDIYVGNPQNSLYDPGFKQSVFQLSYKENSNSADGRWLIPDNVQVSPMMACKLNAESVEIFGSTSYQESLSQDVEIELGIFKSKFTASRGFKKVREETSRKKRVYVSSIAKCMNYKAVFNYPLTITLAREFVNAIADLPTSTPANDDVYNGFIQSFGTHYAKEIDMGAKAIVQSEFEEENWSQLKQDNINVKTGASVSFLSATAGVQYSREEDRKSKTEFENRRTSFIASFLGSHPPTDGRWETWATSTGQSPYPIRYKLRPLSELLDARYIKSIPPSTLLIKKKLLDVAIERYCQQLDGCMNPAPDQIPPIPARMSKALIDFRHETQLFCPGNDWLLSCGMRTAQRKKVDKARSWYPIKFNKRACTCSDWGGATCQAWCSDVDVEMSIAYSGSKRGFSEAYCPPGYVVMGCHMKASNSLEWWKGSYPRNGYCKCYDGQGSSECIATCAPGKYISDYHIKEQQGKGVINVECGGRAIVLGCGYMPSGFGANYERYRDVSVESEKVCRCYDWYGGTCFAICGYIRRP